MKLSLTASVLAMSARASDRSALIRSVPGLANLKISQLRANVHLVLCRLKLLPAQCVMTRCNVTRSRMPGKHAYSKVSVFGLSCIEA